MSGKLKGDVKEDAEFTAEDIETQLSGLARLINVKKLTGVQFDTEKLKSDPFLRGEFYRLVVSDSTLSEEDKQYIIALGLAALANKELF